MTTCRSRDGSRTCGNGGHYTISVYGSYALVRGAPGDGLVRSILRRYGSGEGEDFALYKRGRGLAQANTAYLPRKCSQCLCGIEYYWYNSKDTRVSTVGSTPAVDSHLLAATHVDVVVFVEIGKEGVVIVTGLEADGIHRL